VPDEDVRIRPFWSGTITFGLVSVPVELFPAQRSGGVPLHMFDENGTPLARRYFTEKTDRELEDDEVVRGYEVSKGKYVVVTDEELETLEPGKTRDIDLKQFVPVEQIDPMLFERAYFLIPGGTSNKAYRLLAQILEEEGRAGIATFVMRDKEYLIAITAEKGILRAETLRFPDEIRTPADVGLKKPKSVPPALVKKYESAIKRAKKGVPTAAELKDRRAEKIFALIKRKEKSKKDVVQLSESDVDTAAEPNVIDIMEVLRRSMKSVGKKTSRKSARKSTKRARKSA
jgi:DNA end-binding protein Ku